MTDFADIAAEKIRDDIDNCPRAEYMDFGNDFLARIAAIIRAEYAERELKVANLAKAAEEMRNVLEMFRNTGKLRDIQDHTRLLTEWRRAIAEAEEKR